MVYFLKLIYFQDYIKKGVKAWVLLEQLLVLLAAP